MASDMRAPSVDGELRPRRDRGDAGRDRREVGGRGFEQIPADHFRKAPLDLPPTGSEMELKRDLVTKLKKNAIARRT
jgi:hypothetical protein